LCHFSSDIIEELSRDEGIFNGHRNSILVSPRPWHSYYGFRLKQNEITKPQTHPKDGTTMAGVGKTIDEVASSVLETAANVAQDVLESETAGKVFDTVENTMLPYLMGAASFAYGVVFPEGGQPPTIGGATSNVVVPANSGRRGSSGMSFFYGISKFVKHE
jgi:hypothetical protein